MNEKYIAILPAVFVLMMLVWGTCLLFGKGSILIPSYNMNAKGKEAKHYEKIYCKYVGAFILTLAPFFAVLFVGIVLQISWLTGVIAGLGTVYCLAGMIYLFNNKKASMSKKLAEVLTKYPDYLQTHNVDLSVFDKKRKNNSRQDKFNTQKH